MSVWLRIVESGQVRLDGTHHQDQPTSQTRWLWWWRRRRLLLLLCNNKTMRSTAGSRVRAHSMRMVLPSFGVPPKQNVVRRNGTFVGLFSRTLTVAVWTHHPTISKKMSVGGKKTVLGICGCCCGGCCCGAFGCSILPKECWINGTCVCLCVCVEFCIYKCWRLKCCCVARNYLECSSGPTRINKINGTMLGVDGTAMRRQWLSGGINGC